MSRLRSDPEQTWDSLSKNPHNLPPVALSEIMRPHVKTVTPDTPLTEAAEEMLAHNLQSLPVTTDGVVSGIIRLRDVFHYLGMD